MVFCYGIPSWFIYLGSILLPSSFPLVSKDGIGSGVITIQPSISVIFLLGNSPGNRPSWIQVTIPSPCHLDGVQGWWGFTSSLVYSLKPTYTFYQIHFYYFMSVCYLFCIKTLTGTNTTGELLKRIFFKIQFRISCRWLGDWGPRTTNELLITSHTQGHPSHYQLPLVIPLVMSGCSLPIPLDWW